MLAIVAAVINHLSHTSPYRRLVWQSHFGPSGLDRILYDRGLARLGKMHLVLVPTAFTTRKRSHINAVHSNMGI